MLRNSFAAALVAVLAALPAAASAAGEEPEVTDYEFSFEGPFGTFDQMQLQRGFQLFNTVCNGCHGMQYLSFQSLTDATGPNLPEAQVKAIAATYQCTDPALPAGETRACLPSDNFPANDSMGAPDLALMAKGRAGFHGPAGLGLNQLVNGVGGPEYIASLLTGYTGEQTEVAGNVLYQNHVFPGGLIRMPPPLAGNDVQYGAFTETGEQVEPVGYVPPEPTLQQEAQDIAAFLMWAAEPHMIDRKQAGFRNIVMIIMLAALLYFANKKLWAPVKHRAESKEGA